MTDSPLARWAESSAIVNAELGAQIALRAILDLLERHHLDDAHELVECFGEDVIRYAMSHEAWRSEEK